MLEFLTLCLLAGAVVLYPLWWLVARYNDWVAAAKRAAAPVVMSRPPAPAAEPERGRPQQDAVRPSVPSPSVPSSAPAPASASAALRRPERTRAEVVEALVEAGWSVAQIRAVLVGANAEIGQEVAAARARLGVTAPRRTIPVDGGRRELVIDH